MDWNDQEYLDTSSYAVEEKLSSNSNELIDHPRLKGY